MDGEMSAFDTVNSELRSRKIQKRDKRGYAPGAIVWQSQKKHKFHCQKCKRSFPRMDVLLQHFRDSARHSTEAISTQASVQMTNWLLAKDQKQHCCPLCCLGFQTEPELFVHLKHTAVHQGSSEAEQATSKLLPKDEARLMRRKLQGSAVDSATPILPSAAAPSAAAPPAAALPSAASPVAASSAVADAVAAAAAVIIAAIGSPANVQPTGNDSADRLASALQGATGNAVTDTISAILTAVLAIQSKHCEGTALPAIEDRVGFFENVIAQTQDAMQAQSERPEQAPSSQTQADTAEDQTQQMQLPEADAQTEIAVPATADGNAGDSCKPASTLHGAEAGSVGSLQRRVVAKKRKRRLSSSAAGEAGGQSDGTVDGVEGFEMAMIEPESYSKTYSSSSPKGKAKKNKRQKTAAELMRILVKQVRNAFGIFPP